MDAEMERRWALAKAGILQTQAAFLTIALSRCTTYESLKKSIQEDVSDLESMANDYRKEAEKVDLERN